MKIHDLNLEDKHTFGGTSSELTEETVGTEVDPSIDNLAVKASPIVVQELSGNIEEYEQGYLSGWIIDVNDPTEPVEVHVYENNKQVGEGLADLFRKDLKTLGIGNGCHGFKLKLDSVVLDGEEHCVQVIDANTSMLLGSHTFRSEAFATAVIDGVEAGAVAGTLVLREPGEIGGFDMELLIDGVVSGAGVCALTENNTYVFRIPVPVSYYDGNYHMFSVQLKSLTTKSNLVHERLDSIATPWKYLNDDITSSSLSSLSKIAGYRYEALQAHIRNIGVRTQAIEDIILAHDVLVEGYEDRKKFPVLTLPEVENPRFSIIIPTYNNTALTYNCLAAVILGAKKGNYEVIVIDDCPEDKSEPLTDFVENLVLIKNEENKGFLQSCNAASDVAQGEYIVMLNNDTEVTYGWLDKLEFVFDTYTDVGMAGSKMIYPDGRLQEAGGIVWGNGKPWNIGNRENPDDPVYNYTRQADYISGAAFMIRTAVWNEIGQFSPEYIPAYYEDTDLAFKVRDAGYKTFYCPESVVVHFEGMSNGTDLSSGVKKHQEINAPKFRAKWRAAYRHNGTVGKDLHLEKDRNVDFRVLMIDYSTPRPDQDAGGYAAVQEMRLLQDLGCKLTFLPNNVAHMGAYTHELQRHGVECIYAPFYENTCDFIKARGKEYDLVYITRYDVAEDVLESIKQFSSAKVVLNNADLHFLRELRAALSAKAESLEAPMQTRDRELKVMRSVDAVLSYNDVEHSVIASHNMASENIFKCPWVLSKKPNVASFEDREGIAFLGGFNHLPNREAVNYFVENIMPDLRERMPNVVFNIYGSKVTSDIEKLAGDGVVIKGYVKSLSEIFDSCRVFVAPLLSGAGIKGKVLESISYGVPCVLSPIAAESTGLVHDISTLVARTDAQWVDYIERLYGDKDLWMQMSESSSELVDELYSHSTGLESMSKMLSYLELDPTLNKERLFKP